MLTNAYVVVYGATGLMAFNPSHLPSVTSTPAARGPSPSRPPSTVNTVPFFSPI